MKNPNGYGSVYKLSGKRRKPWAVLLPAQEVPESFTKKRVLLGCYETRIEAMKALSAWNTDPDKVLSTVSASEITFEQLYNEFILTQRFKNISRQTQDNYKSAWKYMSVYKDSKVVDLRTAHFQKIIDSAKNDGKSLSTLQKIKAFEGLLCNYAVQNDIVTKNYASFVVLPKMEQNEKTPFSELELKKIEDAAEQGIMYADLILILCYTGWRINEFLSLTPFSYDKENKTLCGGIKTDAGKGRVVPVNSKILPYLEKWLNKGGDTIICRVHSRTKKTIRVTDKYFRDEWYYPTLEKLGLPRLSPHATRHTFASMLHRNGADKWDIQRLMGHSSLDVTNKVYTHIDIEQLKNAVNLL